MRLIHFSRASYALVTAILSITLLNGCASSQTKQSSILTVPDFGKNVLILDPSMSASAVQSKVDSIFSQQESNQFGPNRYAILLKPGNYNNTIKVGFYTQVMGLGQTPDEVHINGGVQVDAAWFNGDATQNFWRGVENLAVTPSTGTMKWAVAQASPLRRLHVRGNMVLDDGGWSSGGFISDTLVDQQIDTGRQQQWLSRNSRWGSWAGSNWNIVFVGDENAPSGSNWPSQSYTVIEHTPVVREKPFLTIDDIGNYSVFVPDLTNNSRGITWSSGVAAGQSIPISKFYIAKAGVDTAATINKALAKGKHLLLTPGIYELNDTLRVTSANTIVLGLGIATLQPVTGQPAMTVADVDGVKLAGILFDAGVLNSPVLLQVGPQGSSASHEENPTSMHDLFFRVGGAAVGNATVSLRINSNNVIGDDLWLWRADHGAGVGWTTNTTTNGLEVNGSKVTIYGLAVEHYHQYQTVWNGNGGAVYFYQSEAPYDVPDQASWMNGNVNGYASYKVADSVTSHEAWGVGVYCFFDTNPLVKLHSAIEAPNNKAGLNGVIFRNITTVSLGGTGEITHVIGDGGDPANSLFQVIRLAQ
ncbi:MAG TPA: adenylyl cyclase [Methylophilaceae bacterium]|nr:adenylyl cyclase [Methylophilaceae bacterium]